MRSTGVGSDTRDLHSTIQARAVLLLLGLAIVSPAWSLGHWGYCRGTVQRTERSPGITHYFSEVSSFNTTDAKVVQDSFTQFLKENYATERGSWAWGRALCFIDFTTRAEAEAYRSEQMASTSTSQVTQVESVEFVYVAH